MPPTPTHWGLTVAEWLTIAAIVLGPVLAVATQLWFQARKGTRDSKAWVFNTLMGLRALWVNADFVRAFNMVDVVFYGNSEVREKRREFLTVATTATGPELTPQEVERCKDLVAEMLAKMGKELGFEFDHTQIKDTGYYPAAFEKIQAATMGFLEKGVAVLDGKANIGIVVKEEPAPRLSVPPRV